MPSKVVSEYERYANIFRAMAHPSRLFILEQLAKKKMCVHELTELIGDSMPTVSNHLAILKRAGLIEDEKINTQVFYKLKTKQVLNFMKCVRCVIKTQIENELRSIEL